MAESKEEIVYIIGIDRISNVFKIGRTKKSVGERIKELNTGQPYNLFKLITIRTTNAVALEKYLHNKYSKKHIRGEWYELSVADIANIYSEFGKEIVYTWT